MRQGALQVGQHQSAMFAHARVLARREDARAEKMEMPAQRNATGQIPFAKTNT